MVKEDKSKTLQEKNRKGKKGKKNKKKSINNDNNNTKIISSLDKNDKKQFFHTSSKLTRLQRKYCHCLMSVRPKIGKSIPKKNPKTGKKLNHYAVCFGGIRRKMGLHKTQKQKNKFIAMLNPTSANCIMNYNYYAYTNDEIIAMAKEYGIRTSYTNSSGEKKYFKKSTLFNKIVNKYLEKKKLTKKSRMKND